MKFEGEKIGRNDPCWCGSGKKFKKCHLNRSEKPALPQGEITDSLRQFQNRKMCLYPLTREKNCQQVIRAHTIQRRGVLSRITSHDNHVLSFHPLKKDEFKLPIPHPIGWKKASTFLGFCAHHDKQLFSKLEDSPFTGTDQQCFLIGYRALCHELYKKTTSLDSASYLRDNLDKGKDLMEQWRIQTMLEACSMGSEKGNEDLESTKQLFDKALTANLYNSIERVIIYFKGTLSFASTGVVHTEFDFNDRQLQDLSTAKVPAHSLSFGIAAMEQGGAFVATWPKEFTKCDEFINSLLTVRTEDLPSILIEFAFAYIENTYFSEIWWKSLAPAQSARLKELAGVLVQYGSPLRYSRMKYLDWSIVGIEPPRAIKINSDAS